MSDHLSNQREGELPAPLSASSSGVLVLEPTAPLDLKEGATDLTPSTHGLLKVPPPLPAKSPAASPSIAADQTPASLIAPRLSPVPASSANANGDVMSPAVIAGEAKGDLQEPDGAATSSAAAATPPVAAATAATTPPSAAASPSAAAPLLPVGPSRLRRLWSWLGEAADSIAPWSSSVMFHACALIVLGLFVLPDVVVEPKLPPPDKQTEVAMNTGANDVLTQQEANEENPTPGAYSTGNVLGGGGSTDAQAQTVESGGIATAAITQSLYGLASDNIKLDMPVVAGPRHGAIGSAVKLDRRRSAEDGGVQSATGVQGAVDGVLNGIRAEVDKGDLLVIWLVDASISLIDDRQMVAARIEPFYQEMAARDPKQAYRLMNAVVAFGSDMVEVVRPTPFGAKIVEAIRDLPVDYTGLENVMSAVEWCTRTYGKRWRGGLSIIVWTDESGDDILQLEDTIQVCRKRGATVSVVGPSSVFGSEGGRHFYIDPGTKFEFLLPVKRGPDTSLPERLLLPYWHDSPLAPWITEGAMVARGTAWYGGPHREGLLSGVGPYALTRLALETGGTFTILDRQHDRSEFKFETMQKYFPDYRSPADYLKSVRGSPLRKAINSAVAMTYQDVNLIPPSMAFVLTRSPYYPYPVYAPYRAPADFRTLLADELTKQQQLASMVSQVIERALAQFPEAGMESEFAAETSPRWRAWYDLTRGRLLAMSVRHLEYLHACESIRQPGVLGPDTNQIVFHPSSYYRASKIIEKRAREAFRLLSRCVKEHAGTPWEMLANWELAHELGIDVQQIIVPPPQPGPPGKPRAPDPPIRFPNL